MSLLLVIIYAAIGAFIAGFLHEDEEGWVVAIVLLWPIILAAMLTIIILTKPYELGKRLLDKKRRKNETN
jgi:cyanate permease